MTSEPRFHVVLTGETRGDAGPDEVAAALARLFKMPEEKARALLGGKPVVVKKNADEATARKFQVALRQAGARCELKAVAPAAEAAPPAAPRPESEPPRAASPAPAPAAEAQPAGDMEMVGTVRTGGTDFTGPFEVAAAGSDLDTTERPVAGPAPDVSHLSMAEPGADLETLRRDEKPVTPDISHLSLSDD